MVMTYLIFALSVIFIRIFAGYDSRIQKGKYITIKNSVLSAILLDSTSFLLKTKRLKKDKNKISTCGICFYAGALAVLIINIVFFLISDIPIEPWGIETSKFLIYANTLNDKISAIAIFLLLLSIIEYIAVSIIQTTADVKPKWVKIFVRIVAIIMIITAGLALIYFLTEMIFYFL